MKKMSLMVTALVVAGCAQMASAVPNPVFPATTGLYLYDPNTGASAQASMTGTFATYTGTVGDYTLVVSATGNELAGGSNPVLDLGASSVTAAPGTTLPLEIFFSDGVFGPTSGNYSMTTHLSTGVVSASAFLGSSPFSQTTALSTSGTINAQSYYLTLEDQVGPAQTVSFDTYFTTVPEGGTTAMLLGGALTAMAFLKRKFKA